MTGRNIPMMNENAISNILIDVDFLEDEFKRNGRPELCTVFAELRMVSINPKLHKSLSLFRLLNSTSIPDGFDYPIG